MSPAENVDERRRDWSARNADRTRGVPNESVGIFGSRLFAMAPRAAGYWERPESITVMTAASESGLPGGMAEPSLKYACSGIGGHARGTAVGRGSG